MLPGRAKRHPHIAPGDSVVGFTPRREASATCAANRLFFDMRIFSLRIVASSLAFAFAITSSAQQVPSLSKKAAEVKQKADHLSPRAPISVVRLDADEEFGTFISNDQEGFTFYDIDRKTDVTLRYETVKKIKDGYGGYNYAVHRHVDRRKNFIIAAVVLGGLFVLIIAAAAAK